MFQSRWIRLFGVDVVIGKKSVSLRFHLLLQLCFGIMWEARFLCFLWVFVRIVLLVQLLPFICSDLFMRIIFSLWWIKGSCTIDEWCWMLMVGHHWWRIHRVHFLFFVFVSWGLFVDFVNFIILERVHLVAGSGWELWWVQGVEIGNWSHFAVNRIVFLMIKHKKI